jgi:hypothetical protein
MKNNKKQLLRLGDLQNYDRFQFKNGAHVYEIINYAFELNKISYIRYPTGNKLYVAYTNLLVYQI